jgi:hypothetical protein
MTWCGHGAVAGPHAMPEMKPGFAIVEVRTPVVSLPFIPSSSLRAGPRRQPA